MSLMMATVIRRSFPIFSLEMLPDPTSLIKIAFLKGTTLVNEVDKDDAVVWGPLQGKEESRNIIGMV